MQPTSAALKPIPEPLPKTLEAWRRNFERSLNDSVEELHCKLIESKDYRDFLEAVYDEQAVEGSLSADNVMAAEMLRDRAHKEGNPVAKEKLATIVKSLGVVLRRFQLSRTQRRQTVAGEEVPIESSGK